MKKSLEKLCSFDSLYENIVVTLFNQIADNRANNSHYSLSDALKCGFAIYSLKCASLFSFRKRSKSEESNLGSVYGISKIASDNTLRNILDQVSPKDLRKGFHHLYKRIKKVGILKTYQYWRGHLIVSIDGVEHFCSKSISCNHCMTRKHRDGSQSNYHSMLSAALVHPDKKEVFILDNEPIVKQDGNVKNDCERNAIHRLFNQFEKLYNQEFMVFALDALYACAPVVKRLQTQSGWQFVINITPKGNKSLFAQFEAKQKAGQVNWRYLKDDQGVHRFGYVNNLALNDSNQDVKVNMLYYEWTDKKGVTKTFSWITSIRLSKSNVYKIMRIGRSRWKIENETFNTLKNQEYNFEHNFGHGEKYLCTNFAYLMMLAFCVDQIQQSSCPYFRKILKELKTRLKFWESIKAVFKILTCKDMKQVFFSIAEMYQIQLE